MNTEVEFSNRILVSLKQLDSLPSEQRNQMLNAVIGQQVPFLQTTDTKIVEMTPEKSVVIIQNQKKVQNHIQTIHAAAMVLLAETATGMVLSMNMPDDKVQVAKAMNIKFIKMAKGDLKAVATMTAEQQILARTTEKGEVAIQVIVSDQEEKEPVICDITWAWFPKNTP